jgi:hypothetical protein
MEAQIRAGLGNLQANWGTIISGIRVEKKNMHLCFGPEKNAEILFYYLYCHLFYSINPSLHQYSLWAFYVADLIFGSGLQRMMCVFVCASLCSECAEKCVGHSHYPFKIFAYGLRNSPKIKRKMTLKLDIMLQENCYWGACFA